MLDLNLCICSTEVLWVASGSLRPSGSYRDAKVNGADSSMRQKGSFCSKMFLLVTLLYKATHSWRLQRGNCASMLKLVYFRQLCLDQDPTILLLVTWNFFRIESSAGFEWEEKMVLGPKAAHYPVGAFTSEVWVLWSIYGFEHCWIPKK